MDIVTLAGLLKIELRGGATIRLCDGGFVKWGAETYSAADDTFGTIGAMGTISEGVGDEIPAISLTFLPKSSAAAASLSQPGWQNSRASLWIAEVNTATGEVVGTPELSFDGQTDGTELILDRGSRELEMELVSTAERLFQINEGNTLSPRFHKVIWPGELGEDNAIGLGVGIAWGTASPNSTAIGGGGGGNVLFSAAFGFGIGKLF
jgi:hypothetical protein